MVAAMWRALLFRSPGASLPEQRTKEFLLDLDSDTENVNKTPISNYKVSPTLLPSVSEFKNLLNNLIVKLLVRVYGWFTTLNYINCNQQNFAVFFYLPCFVWSFSSSKAAFLSLFSFAQLKMSNVGGMVDMQVCFVGRVEEQFVWVTFRLWKRNRKDWW